MTVFPDPFQGDLETKAIIYGVSLFAYCVYLCETRALWNISSADNDGDSFLDLCSTGNCILSGGQHRILLPPEAVAPSQLRMTSRKAGHIHSELPPK